MNNESSVHDVRSEAFAQNTFVQNVLLPRFYTVCLISFGVFVGLHASMGGWKEVVDESDGPTLFKSQNGFFIVFVMSQLLMSGLHAVAQRMYEDYTRSVAAAAGTRNVLFRSLFLLCRIPDQHILGLDYSVDLKWRVLSVVRVFIYAFFVYAVNNVSMSRSDYDFSEKEIVFWSGLSAAIISTFQAYATSDDYFKYFSKCRSETRALRNANDGVLNIDITQYAARFLSYCSVVGHPFVIAAFAKEYFNQGNGLARRHFSADCPTDWVIVLLLIASAGVAFLYNAPSNEKNIARRLRSVRDRFFPEAIMAAGRIEGPRQHYE